MISMDKYEATGNDFILITHIPKDPSQLAKVVCDRHFGIGADGLMYPSASKIADIKMNYYNADGTIAPMCGNGIRAFAQFLADKQILNKEVIHIETLAGMMILTKIDDQFEVNLGKPQFDLSYPDVKETQSSCIAHTLNVEGVTIKNVYVLNLGTLHTVIFVDDVNQYDHIANALCHHSFFPKYSNINFVKIIDKNNIQIKTYERGVGWTLSCGTGSSASQYLSYKLSLTDYQAKVMVPGGILRISVINEEVFLKGPAKFVGHIEMELSNEII